MAGGQVQMQNDTREIDSGGSSHTGAALQMRPHFIWE